MHHYSLYGIVIDSEIPLPGLPAEAYAKAEVTIRYGAVPEVLHEIKGRGTCFQANQKQVLITVQEIASFLIDSGRTIIVDPCPRTDEAIIRLFLINNALGLLLHQRGYPVLHASASFVDDDCYVFAGASGSGKSALAAAFHRRGYGVLTDDICPICLAAEARSTVPAGFPHIQVWAETLLALGYNSAGFERVRPELEKYSVPVARLSRPARLESIFIVGRSQRHNEPTVTPLGPADSLTALVRHTFKRRYLESMGLLSTQFKNYSDLARQIPVYRLNTGNSFKGLGSFVDEVGQGRYKNRSVSGRSRFL